MKRPPQRSARRPSLRPGKPPSPDGKPVLAFSSGQRFETWLEKHHARHAGFWMRIFKKDSGRLSITYPEALDAALCYGWIDGQKQRGDAASWLQRFTPRGPRSAWSKINTGHVDRLTQADRMKPAGLTAVNAAKADGRWEAAYGSFSTFELPLDFQDALAGSPRAAARFATLSKGIRYRIFYRLTTAKRPKTRARRLQEFLARLEAGWKPL